MGKLDRDRIIDDPLDRIDNHRERIEVLERHASPVQHDHDDEYLDKEEDGYGLAHAISTYCMIPGLRGFWPFSAHDEVGDLYDLSGQGRVMTKAGGPVFRNDGLAPTGYVLGSTDYWSRLDEAGLDILGTESFVGTNFVGLSMGIWFKPGSLPSGTNLFIFNKWNASTADRSYALYHNGTTLTFGIYWSSGNQINTSITALTLSEWNFCAGVFDPQAKQVKVYLGQDGAISSSANTNASATQILNSGAPLRIGARGDGNQEITGDLSLAFLSNVKLADAIVDNLYHQTRSLFGE